MKVPRTFGISLAAFALGAVCAIPVVVYGASPPESAAWSFDAVSASPRWTGFLSAARRTYWRPLDEKLMAERCRTLLDGPVEARRGDPVDACIAASVASLDSHSQYYPPAELAAFTTGASLRLLMLIVITAVSWPSGVPASLIVIVKLYELVFSKLSAAAVVIWPVDGLTANSPPALPEVMANVSLGPSGSLNAMEPTTVPMATFSSTLNDWSFTTGGSLASVRLTVTVLLPLSGGTRERKAANSAGRATHAARIADEVHMDPPPQAHTGVGHAPEYTMALRTGQLRVTMWTLG